MGVVVFGGGGEAAGERGEAAGKHPVLWGGGGIAGSDGERQGTSVVVPHYYHRGVDHRKAYLRGDGHHNKETGGD